MDNYMKSKSEKINISREVLEREKENHFGTGTGKNGRVTNDDVVALLGLNGGKTVLNNYGYCFERDRVENLCNAWGVRIEYIQGLDDFRTYADVLQNAYNNGAKLAENLHLLFSSMGYVLTSVLLVRIEKEHVDEYIKHDVFFESDNSVFYQLKNDSDVADVVSHGLMPELFYFIYNNEGCTGVYKADEINILYNTIKSNFDSLVNIYSLLSHSQL